MKFLKYLVHVDQVLQGAGTANNDNMARTCFKDPRKFARTLDIDEEIVERLAFVLLAFKQKTIVNQDLLKQFSLETYRMIFQQYSWAEIFPTVHKILRHGVDIQQKLKLPTSYYAENAGESAHKYYRNNSREHARQTSRKDRLPDSDPLISSFYLQIRLQHLKHREEELQHRFKSLFNISISCSNSIPGSSSSYFTSNESTYL